MHKVTPLFICLFGLIGCGHFDNVCNAVETVAVAQAAVLDHHFDECVLDLNSPLCQSLYKVGKGIDTAARICFDE